VKNENLRTNVYGSVGPYTRHGPKCPHASDPNFNSCSCPKWLYVWDKQTGSKSRTSLVTPSWAEAQRIASETLEEMDPRIAAALAVTDKHDRQQMTVADACDLWIDRTKRLFGKDSSTVSQYRTLKKKLCAWADAHGISYVQDITSLHLEKWYSSHDWSHLAPTTSAQRWGCTRSMFAFWTDRGILEKSPAAQIKAAKTEVACVQGPYTDPQIDLMMASVDGSIPDNLPMSKRSTYGPRLRTFMRLLLSTGMDVSDGILHEPSRLETHKVGKRMIDVYRYHRIKTGVEAVIPIRPEIAAELRNVPTEPGTSKDMPFRTEDLPLKLDQKKWSNRIAAVLETAGIEFVEVPGRNSNGKVTLKAANTKMIRHTFAVRQLKNGQRVEEVAKMLGHVDGEMVRLHYAPWVKDLDTAHITRVVASWR
jgi:site-specific recombinase XerD